MSYLLSFILVMSLVVIIHEYGHYLFARMFGVKVESFSVGFGPELFGYTDKHKTRWSFKAIPAGGSVVMFGDANEASMPDQSKLAQADKESFEKSLHSKPIYQKSLIAFGGPLFNFISAIIIMSSIYFFNGKVTSEPVVAVVLENSPAYQAGIKSGDIIHYIDQNKISSFEDIRRNISLLNPEDQILIKYSRDGQIFSTTIKPQLIETKDELGNNIKMLQIGASGSLIHQKLSILGAMNEAILESFRMIEMTAKVLSQIAFGNRGMEDVGGPIKIMKYSGQSLQKGFLHLTWLIAVLSINLAFVNLLPIPSLDGGHIFMYGIEAIMGRPISYKYQNYSFKFGMALLLGMFIIFTFNDIKDLLQ